MFAPRIYYFPFSKVPIENCSIQILVFELVNKFFLRIIHLEIENAYFADGYSLKRLLL